MIIKEQIAHNLRSAREAVGMTQLVVAKALGLHRPAIAEIEAGRRGVSSEELYILSQLFARPVADLIEGSALDEVEAALFRRQDLATPEARTAVLRVAERCRSAQEIEQMLGLPAPVPTRSPYMAFAVPPRATDAARQGEDMATHERKRLRLGEEPVANTVGLIERQGIRVGRLVTTSPIDGVYFKTKRLGACVGVNEDRDRWTGFRASFTVAHEYGHWLLGDIEAETVEQDRFTTNLCEIRANAFAAAFLMPRGGVFSYLSAAGMLGHDGHIVTAPTPAFMVQAMSHFDISRHALLTRLRSLELLTQEAWADAHAQDFSVLRVAQALGISLKTDHMIEARFTQLVIQAWTRALITTGRAADLLGLEVDEFRDRMREIGAEVEVLDDLLLGVA